MRQTETKVTEVCRVCGSDVEVMCFRGTGICSTNCEKFEKGEKLAKQALAP